MILLDTSGVLAALVSSQRAHDAARRALEEDAGPLVLSPFVLAELDYFLSRRIGLDAALAFLAEIEAGAYELASFDASDVGEARRIVEAYRDLDIGLADASLVVLAGKLGTERILTLDERHFRTLRAPSGRAFTLLPADA